MAAILEIAERYAAYLGATVSPEISEHDDMLARGVAGANEHYFAVGRSAIDLIAGALVTAQKTTVRTILDLPCGGGRVCRHLRAFFPDAEIFVGDLNAEKQKFVVETLGGRNFRCDPGFLGVADRQFDLIFVGSLVTHLEPETIIRATEWFIAALAPDGLLILTTHGRRHQHLQQSVHHYIPPESWAPAREAWISTGFGYAAYADDPNYGVSVSSPSWVMRLVEDNPASRIVSFQEAAWAGHQDVLVLQKRQIDAPPG